VGKPVRLVSPCSEWKISVTRSVVAAETAAGFSVTVVFTAVILPGCGTKPQ
jgi:hypothetical protein